MEYKSEEEIKEEENKWKKFDPEKDTRTPAEKKEYEKNQKIRAQANAERKQFDRWQSLMGDSNYKTIGAFRRGKRSNSKKFQELQSKYRSLSMRKDDAS